MDDVIAALESTRGFVARTAALDALELSSAHGDLPARAQELLRRLESQNERVVERLRQRIRAGRYSRSGLLRAFARCAEPRDAERGYDALDVLFAGLLDAGELPEEQVTREPEMVAYQPTPAHAILALIDELRADDVFYDVGSGLGRVVILVALLSGARARGIELEPAFCDYAARCAASLSVQNAEFIQADAREAQLAGGTIFFLYTPFRGSLLQQVLARLQLIAAARAIRICTFGPCTAEVAACSWLRLRSSSPSAHELAVFQSLKPA